MSLPSRIDHCPLSLTCSVTGLWRDPDTDKIYTFNTSTQQYRPHRCAAKAVELPTIAFGSKWVSKKTGNTRVQGPVRLERSALIAPADSQGTARKKAARTGEQEWMFVGLFQGEIHWKETDVPDHFKEEFFAEFERFVDKEEEDSDEA